MWIFQKPFCSLTTKRQNSLTSTDRNLCLHVYSIMAGLRTHDRFLSLECDEWGSLSWLLWRCGTYVPLSFWDFGDINTATFTTILLVNWPVFLLACNTTIPEAKMHLRKNTSHLKTGMCTITLLSSRKNKVLLYSTSHFDCNLDFYTNKQKCNN